MMRMKVVRILIVESYSFFYGFMSIVGVGFYKSRSIIAFKSIFMFFMQRHIFLHGKQTSKHPHGF